VETSIIIALLILLSISISVFFWFRIKDLEAKKAAEHEKMMKNTREQLRTTKENANRMIKQATAKAETYEQAVEAMKQIIDGYGNEHLLTKTVFDDLAEECSHKKAGMELKQARLLTSGLIIGGRAALCDYPEHHQKMAAIRFILDAFNGKVDSTMARIRYDDYGKLEAEITTGFGLVNGNGRVFGNTRVTNEYLKARLSELKWAAAVDELETPDNAGRGEIAEGEALREEATVHQEETVRKKEKVVTAQKPLADSGEPLLQPGNAVAKKADVENLPVNNEQLQKVQQEEVNAQVARKKPSAAVGQMPPKPGKALVEKADNKALPVKNEQLKTHPEVKDVLKVAKKEEVIAQEAPEKTQQKITAQKTLTDSGRIPPRLSEAPAEKAKNEDLAVDSDPLQQSFRARKETAAAANQITAIREQVFQPATFQRPGKARLMAQPVMEQVQNIG